MKRKSLALFSIMGIILFSSCLFFVYNQQSDIFLTDLKPPKGIILISLDTLRADHLGTYGYGRNTSPHIDAFAKESVVFETAVVQSPWTLPSHMSIMTSLYPSSHGVVVRNNRLAEEHVTLAELLREKGYRTAAFADGAFMKGDYGFKQGFDIYDGDNWIGIARILPKAKKWLEENKADPFFLFIHCYDIHDPYTPPPPYDTIFHDFNYTGNFVPSTKNMQAAAWRGLEVNDEDVRHIKALYDGGIRYTDEKIGEFLSYLQEAGLKDNSLVIITSDHGEEFKEHGSFLHWKLYFRPNLHVPLIMHFPNYPMKEIRIKELVQSIDILPTILDSAHLPPHAKAQGRSLLPVIRRNSTFLRRSWWRIFHSFIKKEDFSFAEGEDKKTDDYSIIKGNYQLMYDLESKSTRLFNIKNDPLAQNNISNNHEALAKRLLSKLISMHNEIPKYKTTTFTLDEETRKQLEELGYINDREDAMGETYEPSQMGNH
jgi:arylsulfatase A-like enzyme